MNDLAKTMVSLVARAERLQRAWLQPRLAALGVSVAHFRLVGLLLGEDQGHTQQELATRLGVRAATVSVALAELERRGVVTRTVDPGDARIKRVKLAGRLPRMAATIELVSELEALGLASISKRDLATTKRVLGRLIANLESGET